MLGKSRIAVFFSMICGPAGSKNGLAKAVGVYRRNEKLHAAEARSMFASQNVQNTTLFGIAMWKNGTPLQREAHLQVKH